MPFFTRFRYWLAFRLACASLAVAPEATTFHELPLFKVREFFVEHPLHGFSIRAVAEYLGEDETEVELTAGQLESEGFLVRRYRLADPAALAKEEWS